MAKRLKFRKKYKDAIVSERKVTTIRLNTKLKPGDVVDVIVGDERIGKATVEDVSESSIGDLTDEHARRDGFSSRDELIKELFSIYGKLNLDTKVKIIKFKLVNVGKFTENSQNSR